MSAATGIVLLDILVRPFFKIWMKFPQVGILLLALVYGLIAYVTLRSAYSSNDQQRTY